MQTFFKIWKLCEVWVAFKEKFSIFSVLEEIYFVATQYKDKKSGEFSPVSIAKSDNAGANNNLFLPPDLPYVGQFPSEKYSMNWVSYSTGNFCFKGYTNFKYKMFSFHKIYLKGRSLLSKDESLLGRRKLEKSCGCANNHLWPHIFQAAAPQRSPLAGPGSAETVTKELPRRVSRLQATEDLGTHPPDGLPYNCLLSGAMASLPDQRSNFGGKGIVF